jgi:serine/threonine protein kinase
MSYAKKGNLRKCLSNIIKFKWQDKLQLLKKIILGLKVIHESDLTHGDLHDGNILMSDNHNELFIIDLGLCKSISNLQDSNKKSNEIYGVLPYMAPEILRCKPYTPASDIYSFSMIMWEFTSGVSPFNNMAHDLQLSLNICKGNRPKIIENTPKCYVDLMKKCWDSDPSNRPTIIILENIISEWIRCINEYYKINRDGKYTFQVLKVNGKLKDDMFEFVKANEALIQIQTNTSIIESKKKVEDIDGELKCNTIESINVPIGYSNLATGHPQACYTSRLYDSNQLNEILESKGLNDYIIKEDIK